MKDAISTRMKTQYEHRTQTHLPRRTYTIIRVDGKAFHTYTRGLDTPFDIQLMTDMNVTAQYLCAEIQGSQFAFVQSDEISILLTDFATIETQAWFDGNVQKMVSVSASLATGIFNQLRPGKLAFFDSRVFTVPDPTEVENYFIWRQQDAVRNSILSVAQSSHSPNEMEGKNTKVLQEMIYKRTGINWNDYPVECKQGRIIRKEYYYIEESLRTRWVTEAPPTFTKQRSYITELIPTLGY